ncbi:hypothetical protein QN357_01445 [Cryobacterium sp. RTC2.1]|uniref:hypothetical protein n=1 Tax=Cryobacterium sp. RTC2.1 TaxID=3048634 RepID=UPI002B23EB5E|nr:hypothetical protein [Cryobacterium sp. RTC2.1]MEB0001600.1 hypothetical protein [Cryobacterium sp. RTC2.1]
MAKILVNGRELVVKPIHKARNRDLIELQVQSGLKLSEIMERAKASDLFATVMCSFLAQHNAGFQVKWNDLIDGTSEDLGEFVTEPGDDPAKAEAEAEANPTQPDSATLAPVDEPNPSPTPE